MKKTTKTEISPDYRLVVLLLLLGAGVCVFFDVAFSRWKSRASSPKDISYVTDGGEATA